MAKIKKQYQKNYTTVDNTVLNDKTLSWKAKGLFAYLWSKPDNWDYTALEVSKHAKDGVGSTSVGVQELEDHGYLKREQANNKGKFGGNTWTLSEQPIFKKPLTENPITDNPSTENPITDNPSTENALTENPFTGNRPQLNTELLSTDNTNKRITNNGMTKSKGAAQPTTTIAAQRREVIEYLNEKTGKHFKPDADGNKRIVDPRLKEGYTVAEMKQVIDNMYAEWHGKTWDDGTPADNYLRPETLFRASKIEGYRDWLSNKNGAANNNRRRNGQPRIQEQMPAWWYEQQKQENKPKEKNWFDELPEG